MEIDRTSLINIVGATLIPINPQHRILKIPWTRPTLQIGRGPPQPTGNDVVLLEKRVSNKHCRISLGIDGINGQGPGDDEPDVWIEDLKSSNGSYVSVVTNPILPTVWCGD
jgi:pSer/pThr/pTyr-binding forkhead associated (FHA) protein